jgi:HEAT repeat protein
MSHLSISASGPLAAASLLLLGLSLLRLFALEQRQQRRDREAAERQSALEDALERADASALARHCLQARNDPDLDRDLRAIVGRGLSSQQRGLLAAAAQETGLIDCLRARLASADAITRGRAAQLVAALSSAEPALELEPLLEDEDADVRLAAARAIGELETREADRVLIRALGRDAIEPDRLLEQLARPGAVRELVLASYRPESAPIRGLLAEALGLTRSLLAIATLASLVRVGSDEERLRACRALGRIGRPDVVPLLLEALADDTWPVRAQAARGLTGLAGLSCIGDLERALCDRAWWVRANAAEALRIAGPEGIAALERAASGSDRFAAERAREALALATARGDGARALLEIAA